MSVFCLAGARAGVRALASPMFIISGVSAAAALRARRSRVFSLLFGLFPAVHLLLLS